MARDKIVATARMQPSRPIHWVSNTLPGRSSARTYSLRCPPHTASSGEPRPRAGIWNDTSGRASPFTRTVRNPPSPGGKRISRPRTRIRKITSARVRAGRTPVVALIGKSRTAPESPAELLYCTSQVGWAGWAEVRHPA